MCKKRRFSNTTNHNLNSVRAQSCNVFEFILFFSFIVAYIDIYYWLQMLLNETNHTEKTKSGPLKKAAYISI